MQCQQGEITEKQLAAAWKQATKRKKESFAFKDVQWPRGRCGAEKKVKDVAPNKQNDLRRFATETLLVRGAWQCCLSCLAQASLAPTGKRWCDICKVFLPTSCFLSKEERNICLNHLKLFQHDKMHQVRSSCCGQ